MGCIPGSTWRPLRGEGGPFKHPVAVAEKNMDMGGDVGASRLRYKGRIPESRNAIAQPPGGSQRYSAAGANFFFDFFFAEGGKKVGAFP